MSKQFKLFTQEIETMFFEEEKACYKLKEKGPNSCTNVELLTMLIGDERKARKLLQLSNNELLPLFQKSRAALKKSGLTEKQTSRLIASFEILKRRKLEEVPMLKIATSEQAYRYIAPEIADLPHEEFWVLLLNRSCNIIGKKCISKGGVSATVVDAKLIFKAALDVLASSIILFHNHPSGNRQPSRADIDLTKKLKNAGRSMDINVIDHIICTSSAFYSFSDEGEM